MEWAPTPENLDGLLVVLRKSQEHTNEAQQYVRERVDVFSQVAEFNKYLAYVLVHPIGDTILPSHRAVAGYMLSNNIRSRWSQFHGDVGDYVRSIIFNGLLDPDHEVRKSAINVVNGLIRETGPQNYPEAFQKLMSLLEGDETNQAAAMDVLTRLCEDVPKRVESTVISGVKLTDVLIPKFLSLADIEPPLMRAQALKALNAFLYLPKDPLPTIFAHINLYLEVLFRRAHDPNSAVRKLVCTAMNTLLAHRPELILPQINGVVDYMIHCTKDEDPNLALEACEFWLTFAEAKELEGCLRIHLPKVAPVLLDAMCYSEDELIALGGFDDDDAAVPDRPEDIKPRFYSDKSHAQEHEGAQADGLATVSKSRELDDDDEDEYDDEDDEDYSEWTVRKCAAAALDVMAVSFGGELLPLLLPRLKDKLYDPDWLQREAAILAVGAIAEGCMATIQSMLDSLVPYLISMLSFEKPLVRSIACWALGRYAGWCIKRGADAKHKQDFFFPALTGLMRTVLDNNKRVQEAGCSAFATLEEEAGAELEPFLPVICQTLAVAFQRYQRKNLMILYDAVGTLADSVGSALNQKPLIDLVMPPLIEKYNRLDDEDSDIIPLFECMSSIVIAIGQGFAAFTPPVFDRCIRIISHTVVHYQQYVNNPLAFDPPDKTFLIVALDLLSGLTQGLGPVCAQLYESSVPPTFPLIQFCLTYPEPPVRQSAYALIGDCAISIFPYLAPHIPSFLPTLIEHIESEPVEDTISACNNATWAAGEIAMKYGTEMQPYATPLLQRLIPVLMSHKAVRSLNENSAVTIGRLGLVCPQSVAPHLEMFIYEWCNALAEIKDNDEKDSAFRGICMVIQANPNGLVKHFTYFLHAVGKWHSPSPELSQMFQSILGAFKSMSGPQWELTMGSLPVGVQARLHERYGV